MALFGLFKPKEQREFEEDYATFLKFQSRMRIAIDLAEGNFSDSDRQRTALLVADAVMREPLSHETIDSFLEAFNKRSPQAQPDPEYAALLIVYYFLSVWVKLSQIRQPKFIAVLGLIVTAMEGSLLGFLERAGVPAWQPCYSPNISDFIETRRRYFQKS